ncbi:hypothetical protein [Alcaligenes faecalis]|uniref:hypothetical protein n=1 Tax=Alcaligenes faecalis TaxID=511 RepID=UPI0011C0464F|nr:hypothetical protein [Alcaligenes faecalis]
MWGSFSSGQISPRSSSRRTRPPDSISSRRNSIIILDGDVEEVDSFKTVVLLPSQLAPDQLIFEFLYNLPPNHEYWKNQQGFTKPIFNKISQNLLSQLKINSEKIELRKILTSNKEETKQNKAKNRELFKKFYKEKDLQTMIKSRKKTENPWLVFLNENKNLKETFIKSLKEAHIRILVNSYGIEKNKAEQAWNS